MQVVIPKLNVRSGPGLTYKDKDCTKGIWWKYVGLAARMWVQIEPGRWVAYALKDESPHMVLLPP